MSTPAIKADAMNRPPTDAQPMEAIREDLLCAYHVLDLEGQGSGLGGHVSARVPGEAAFWCHAWGLAFEEVTPDDLVKVDFSLNKLAGRGKVNPTLIFHARIYTARPDVACVVHTHADHVTALTATGGRFEMVTQLSAILHEDHACLDEYDGLVVNQLGGDHLAEALGDKRILLLKNHGLISVGSSIGAAVIGAVVLEANAKLQLAVMAAGTLSPLPAVAAADARRFLTTETNTHDRWAMFKRRAARARPACIPATVLKHALPAP